MRPEILVGDVGGTNTRLALATHSNGAWTLRDWEIYPTADLTDMSQAVDRFLADHRPHAGTLPCCLSGAGPVRKNVSHLSNVNWTIDGPQLERRFDLHVLVINDFSAICYGLPALPRDDRQALVPIPHTDGTFGRRDGTVWAAVGAGTGLGIGFLVTMDGRHLALPSEGGHALFGAFDEETQAMKAYVSAKLGSAPGSEQFVSGQGIVNAFEYLVQSGRYERSEEVQAVIDTPDDDKPAVISNHAGTDPCCSDAMALFVRMYGKVASNAALTVLPSAGVFLAGGIAAKNESWFTERDDFMQAFEDNYKESVRPFLRRCPVFIVKDTAVALLGAAHAAEQFLEEAAS
jgi:glucokinase